MNIYCFNNLNVFSAYVVDSIKSVSINLTIQQRRIYLIASLILGCLVVSCTLFYCLKRRKIKLDKLSVEEVRSSQVNEQKKIALLNNIVEKNSENHETFVIPEIILPDEEASKQEIEVEEDEKDIESEDHVISDQIEIIEPNDIVDEKNVEDYETSVIPEIILPDERTVEKESASHETNDEEKINLLPDQIVEEIVEEKLQNDPVQNQIEEILPELPSEKVVPIPIAPIETPITYILPNFVNPGERVYAKYIDSRGELREGEFEKGQLNGKGKYFSRIGHVLEGQFKDNQLHGQGKFTDQFGNVREGIFQDGTLIDGKYYDASGPVASRVPGQQVNGKYIDQFGNVKQGCFKNYALNGQGKMSDVFGNVREGEFKDNQLHGQGKRIFPNQTVWEGEFICGKFTGKGKLSFRAGKSLARSTLIKTDIFRDILLFLHKKFYPNADLIDIDNKFDDLQDLDPKLCNHLYSTLEGFAQLNENFEEFKERLRTRSHQPSTFIDKDVHAFIFHINTGVPNIIFRIEESLRSFEKQYEYHQKKGSLKLFFTEAFSLADACFEARSDRLQEYQLAHPIEEKPLNVNLLVDYTKKNPFEKIFQEELRVFNELKREKEGLKLDSLTPLEEFKTYLLENRKITNIEGYDKLTHEIRKITVDDTNKILTLFKEVYTLIE